MTLRLSIIAIILTTFSYGLSIGMNFVIVPLFFEYHGLNKSMIGLIMAAEICTPLIIMPLLPKYISKFGLKKILILSIILRNLVIAFLPLTDNIALWIILMLLFGIGGYSLFTSLQLWINNISANNTRGTYLGTLNCSLSLGAALGPFILKFTSLNGHTPFLVSSLVCSLALIPLLLIGNRIPDVSTGRSIKILSILKRAPLPIFAGIVMDFIFFSLSTFLVLYGMAHGLSKDSAALLITSMLIGTIVFDVPLGWISDRVNRKKMIFACAFIILVCSQILPFVITNHFYCIMIFTFWCGSMGAIYTCSLALLGDKYKGAKMVTANSVFSFMNCTGGISGIILTGIAIDLIGKSGLTIMIGSACTVFLLFGLYVYYMQNHKLAEN